MHWISFLAGLIVIVALLRREWASASAGRTAALILFASCLELTSYQYFLYRSPNVEGHIDLHRATEVAEPRLTLWREPDVLPQMKSFAQWLRERGGARTRPRICFSALINAREPRLDFYNLHLAELAAIANGSPSEAGYPISFENSVIDSSNPQLRHVLGCSNPVDAAFAGPYRSSAARPEPLDFAFPTETVVQGVEILFEQDHSERAPAAFAVMGSVDNANWATLFTASPHPASRASAASRSWWFSNNTAYKWYRIAFRPRSDSPVDVTAAGVLLKTDSPMIRLTSDVQLVDSDEDARNGIARMHFRDTHDQNWKPFIIQAPQPLAAALNHNEPESPDSVSLIQRSYNSVEVHAEVGHGGQWLVFSDSWHPGWEARVDGVFQPVRRADIAFKAVWLNPGSHDVTFEFHNRVLLWSYALMMMNYAGCLIIGLAYLVAGPSLP